MPLTTYTSGQVLTAASLNANLSFAATSGATDVAIFNETQSAGTNGGTATSGSFIKRTLNTTIVNGITGCSIAASVITLPAGTYIVQGFGTVHGVVNGYKSRLQNTSDATTASQGTSGSNSTGVSTNAEFNGHFTIASSKNFELQTRVATTANTNGYGTSVSFGDEVYSQIIITKVA